MGRYRSPQAQRWVVKRSSDLAERQPEPPQKADAVEPLDVGVTVKAMPGGATVRSYQQADLLVVVQRPHRDIASVRQAPTFRFAPSPLWVFTELKVRPHAT